MLSPCIWTQEEEAAVRHNLQFCVHIALVAHIVAVPRSYLPWLSHYVMGIPSSYEQQQLGLRKYNE